MRRITRNILRGLHLFGSTCSIICCFGPFHRTSPSELVSAQLSSAGGSAAITEFFSANVFWILGIAVFILIAATRFGHENYRADGIDGPPPSLVDLVPDISFALHILQFIGLIAIFIAIWILPNMFLITIVFASMLCGLIGLLGGIFDLRFHLANRNLRIMWGLGLIAFLAQLYFIGCAF